MTQTLEIVLALLALLVAASVLARRVSFPEPLLMVPIGVAVSYVPGMPALAPHPDLVLHVFLPLLIYATAINVPWRHFRANLRPIGSLAVGLVLFTTAGVAILAHAIIPGLSWAAAIALGAIISPPDEVAAASVLDRLPIPKRITVILQGEGLVNDVAALTIFRLAILAAMASTFSLPQATVYFLVALVGGAAYGFAVGWAALKIRGYLDDPRLETTVSLLTPFVAYLGPEYFDASGVLATAVAGLVVNAKGPTMISAETRLHGTPIWQMIDFWLNGILFLLLGLQFRAVLGEVPGERMTQYLEVALAISIAAVVLRFVWVYVVVYTPLLWKPEGAEARAPRPTHVFMVSWTGMRGAISLAAALSLPLTLSGGKPFPERELIIFVTFAVIALTLIVQGGSLPFLIRWLGLDREGAVERNDQAHIEYAARIRMLDAGMKRLDELMRAGRVAPRFGAAHRRELRERKQTFQRHGTVGADSQGRALANRELGAMIEVTEAQRGELLGLRGAGKIDDETLRRIERDLDEAELRLQTRVDTLPRRRGTRGA
jgi:CPA1 family monovalent cation:H+ antiporter